MAALILPSRRIAQPQGFVEIDWSNPLTVGLVAAYIGNQNLYVTRTVDKYVAPHVTPLTYCASRLGVGYRHSSYFSGAGTLLDIGVSGYQSNATLLCVSIPGDTTSETEPLAFGGGFGHRIISAAGSVAGRFAVNFRNATRITADAAVSNLFDASVVFARNIQGVEQSLFVGGKKQAATLTTTIDALSSGNFGPNVVRSALLLDAAWTRALSDAEIRSLTENPWQLFKQQNRSAYFLPASTGGGSIAYSLTADFGSYSLNGQAATLTYVAGAASYSLACAVGSYALNCQDATLGYVPGAGSYTLTCDAGYFALSGVAAGVVAGRKLAGDFGAYSLTGNAAGVSVGRRLTADVGAYAFTGQDATMTFVGAAAYSLTAEAGLYALDGQSATLTGPTSGGLTQAGIIPKVWPLTVRYEGKSKRKHEEEERKRLIEVAEDAVEQAAEEATRKAMRSSIEASMKAAELELARATIDRLLSLAVQLQQDRIEEEELEIALLLM